jgi:hypothetical protein
MMRLPVISLRVPHSPSFDLVNGFLYAHDPERLLLGLLPIAPSTNPTISEVRRTAERIAWSSDSKDLVVNAQFIHGFWRNVTALGISDEVLWQTLELAWAVSLKPWHAIRGCSRCPKRKLHFRHKFTRYHIIFALYLIGCGFRSRSLVVM